MPLMTGNVNGL